MNTVPHASHFSSLPLATLWLYLKGLLQHMYVSIKTNRTLWRFFWVNSGFLLFSSHQHLPIILETLTIASHSFLISAPDHLYRARHTWVIRQDPSLTISLSPHSFYRSVSWHAFLCLSPHLSLPPPSSAISSLSLSPQNSVLLYSCIIQSKLHQHCNQSRSLSCGLSLSWRATDMWAATSLSFTETLPEMWRSASTANSWEQLIFFSEKLPCLMQRFKIIYRYLDIICFLNKLLTVSNGS